MNKEFTERFLPYFSTTYTRTILSSHYQSLGITDPTRQSYATCYSFISHLKHGCLYYQQASTAPLEIKPLLFFYGFIQFMKASILTKDYQYPSSSQVLAHGVTTRKRKKDAYLFLEDEVKTQRNGLYSHFLSQMFHMKHVEGERYKMKNLFIQIADLHPLITTLTNSSISYQIKKRAKGLLIPSDILDQYHMTQNRLYQYFNKFISEQSQKQTSLQASEKDLILNGLDMNRKYIPPFLMNKEKEFFLLKDKETHLLLPELAVLYLILYNLSMICRYEVEWWNDLISTYEGMDYPYILTFLDMLPYKSIHLFHQLIQFK
ncbi:YaaC family protein [Alkalihalobacillus trypoxylicola]|uniref:YaaC n=1 Tax=Alkalihalobacillus trypoxylicola TaxID=519424 RepID=A0A161PIU7_9BACI|nr:YaaC family protein [Alkalihalobacillus trypoxylicola]KYG29151.1 hypothetical protein AZF04_20115 [Alkalihalobacillus trypoxylicola]